MHRFFTDAYWNERIATPRWALAMVLLGVTLSVSIDIIDHLLLIELVDYLSDGANIE